MWTDERKAELRERWAIDPSRTRIARAMGVTPNSIIGMSRRLNLHYAPSGKAIELSPDHSASIEGHTLFPSKVLDPETANNILKPGEYQRKLGGKITKGRWKGFPVFALTLEERATCPRDCAVWNSCYGNGMHNAARYRHGQPLERKLWSELKALQARHAGGFVIRTHVLGDYYSRPYVDLWARALAKFPALHVFGYTARQPGTPIGNALARLRDGQWDRFAIRTSGATEGPRTLVVDSAEAVPDGAILCPAQTGKTLSCSTCALCWQSTRPVAFLRH